MRKFILCLPLLGLVFTSTAQVDNEAVFLTGGLNFTNSDGTMSISDGLGGTMDVTAIFNNFSFQAGGGYMFTEEIGAGLKLGYQNASQKADFDGIDMKSSVGTFMITPFARTYFEIDEPLYAVFDLNFGFGFGNNKTSIDSSTFDQKFNVLDINIEPGFAYFFTDNFALELKYGYIGYSSQSQTIDDGNGGETKSSTGTFMFSGDLNTLRLGIVLMFNN